MSDDPIESEFNVGQLVFLKVNPSVVGAVIQVLPSAPENRYLVFIGGKSATYYASQLHAAQAEDESLAIIPLQEFQARLTALQIQQPSLSNLYSLHASRVNFVPYQFRPVLKFIRSDRPRLLIADEVGVGKTIEAGLILRELQSRRDINSVLIICPKPLVTERKWQLEMKRFDEDFVHLDGNLLRHCIREADLNGYWPEKQAKSILPFSLFDERMLYGGDHRDRRRKLGLTELDPPPRFDLVIVDEAHHLRNSNTFVHQGVRFFTDNAEAVVFLTATPIQLESDDLFVLLNLLRPDLILDRQSFQHMSEPNPHINAAVECARAAEPDWQLNAHNALVSAGVTAWGHTMLQGNVAYQRACRQLTESPFTPQERLAFVREAESLHTFANLINRTRRRDIGNFTTRKPESVEVEFTPPQRELHDALLQTQARILLRSHDPRIINFLLTTLKRQAASCIYGLAPLMQQILTRGLLEIDWDESEADEESEAWDAEAVMPVTQEIEQVLALARNLDAFDPKKEALLQIVRDKQALPNNKILLFSSFRHTLRYLLAALQYCGVRVGLIHGDVPDEERTDLRNRFSRPKDDPTAIDLLLSSEVGCEGLDYQFCDCLVNYDLPWNPMRIEQRIGRIDRYGQLSETVAIYNIVTPGTVDYDIYQRCLLRIGVFRQALGGSEEILGRITRELRSVAENLQLSDAEREARLQQIADNDIRLIQEQERLEQQQVEFFGLVLPPHQLEQDVRDASSAWLEPKALQNLVQSYLTKQCGGDAHILGDRPLKTLRLNQDARNILLEDLRRLPRKASPIYREWEKWLKGSDYLQEITFDSICAGERRQSMFLTPIHPLVQQAATLQQEAPPFRTSCRVVTNAIPPGEYPFAIYQWQKHGIREDAALQPICLEPKLTEQFLSLLETADPAVGYEIAFPDASVFEQLESAHYSLWSQARTRHQEETIQIARYRKESLRVSHQSRLALLREQQAQTNEERIRRMRASQIAHAEGDYLRRLGEIEIAENRADILSDPVAYGVMIVEVLK